MAEGRFQINAGTKPKKVATPPVRASLVPGSRPPDLRAPAIQRIKPMAGQTQYGKAGVPNPAGAVAGPMGQNPYA